ncbi:MAG: EthD family reductase [Pseudomonadales bacterium]|nr:EthD family reductase [Pseudomonadales bacterium]MCP5185107.1 EthD family reductase [Pseudomonadales bacterium]
MIRITFLLRRRPDVPAAEFYRYWLEEHGPLVASHARRLNMLRYVQVHTIDDPANAAMAEARGGMEPVYDGVAEVWFASREALVAATSTPAGRAAGAALVEDEAKFIDLPNSPIWLAHEYPQVNPTPENLVARPRNGLVKLYFPLRARADVGEEAAQFYWRTSHGPLIRQQAAGSAILRYVQVHRANDPIEADLRAARGTVVDSYTGHAELWLDRADMGVSTPERRQANQRAIEDEATFIDFRRSCMWFAKEHVFVDHR